MMELPRLVGVTGMSQLEEIRPLVGEDPEREVLTCGSCRRSVLSVVISTLLLLLAAALPVRARLAVLALLGGVGTILVTHVALARYPAASSLAGIAISPAPRGLRRARPA